MKTIDPPLQEVSLEEEARLKRIRKQMRDQDRAKYMDPDKPEPEIHAMFVWRKVGAVFKWVLVTWMKGRVTLGRVEKFRRKMQRKRPQRVRRGEIVRVVEFRALRRFNGEAGASPLAAHLKRANRTAKARRGRPVRKSRFKGVRQGKGVAGRLGTKLGPQKVSNPAKSLTNLRRVTGRKRPALCATKVHRGKRPIALWDVCYTGQRGKPVKTPRCAKCAWDASWLPDGVKNVVRIERAKNIEFQRQQLKERAS